MCLTFYLFLDEKEKAFKVKKLFHETNHDLDIRSVKQYLKDRYPVYHKDDLFKIFKDENYYDTFTKEKLDFIIQNDIYHNDGILIEEDKIVMKIKTEDRKKLEERRNTTSRKTFRGELDTKNRLPSNITERLQKIKEQFLFMQYKTGIEDIDEIFVNLSSNIEKDREEALKKIKDLSWIKIWDLSDDSFIENHTMSSWLKFIQKTIKETEKYIMLQREIYKNYLELEKVCNQKDILKHISKNIYQLYHTNKNAKIKAHQNLSSIKFDNEDFNFIYKQILKKSEDIVKGLNLE